MIDPLDVRDRLLAKRVKKYEDAKLKRPKWNPSQFGFTHVGNCRRRDEKRKLCQPNKYCVYALADNQGAFYIGITNDVVARWRLHKVDARSGRHAISNRIFNNLRNEIPTTMFYLEWTNSKKREGVWFKFFEEELKIPLMNVLKFGHDV